MIADSRPRVTYLLPEGTPIKIIFDHGEVAPATTTFQRANGDVAIVTKAPVTRALPVVVEKSGGGLNGWWIRVGAVGRWLTGTPIEALETARLQMMAEGVAATERGRVLGLLIRELNWKRCATVTAEVVNG